MSIPLGAISLTRASISGMATVLIKKYQKKLTKVMKLVDILTSALETSAFKALNNSKTDEWEVGMFQTLYSRSLSELMGVDHKMEAENRNQFKKSLLEEIDNIKSTLKTTRAF